MATTLSVVLYVGLMLALVLGLHLMQRERFSFTARVLAALGAGILFGAMLQYFHGATSPIVVLANGWFAILGSGYVRLLTMIVIPLVFVSITTAIVNLEDSRSLGRMGGLILGILVLTASIAAAVGAGSASAFGLNAQSIQTGENEQNKGKRLETQLLGFKSKTYQQQLTEIVPTNPFFAMTGQGDSATLSVVFFAALVGVSTLGLKKKKPESAEFFGHLLNSLHDVVMRVVTMILRMTPFGILALMTRMVSTSHFSEMTKLVHFVAASYLAILVMFGAHLTILAVAGLNPFTYVRKVIPVLTFAFSSRSSAGTLPLTIETQTDRLGVSEAHANLSSTLGTSIGQNGCAGIYPAMLAVMIAPAMGINPMAPAFLIKLIVVTALASFGVAGVGGGATFAALTVLSAMGMPVGLAGVLIAIEPLIDMARTALNVSGSMVAGLVSSKLMNQLDVDLYVRMQDAEPQG